VLAELFLDATALGVKGEVALPMRPADLTPADGQMFRRRCT